MLAKDGEIKITKDNKFKLAKAGKLLCIDKGAYSDYVVCGFFVILRDFYPNKELAEYLLANPTEGEPYSFEEDKFLATLLAKGLLLELEYGTLYLTAYSNCDEFRFTPAI